MWWDLIWRSQERFLFLFLAVVVTNSSLSFPGCWASSGRRCRTCRRPSRGWWWCQLTWRPCPTASWSASSPPCGPSGPTPPSNLWAPTSMTSWTGSSSCRWVKTQRWQAVKIVMSSISASCWHRLGQTQRLSSISASCQHSLGQTQRRQAVKIVMSSISASCQQCRWGKTQRQQALEIVLDFSIPSTAQVGADTKT